MINYFTIRFRRDRMFANRVKPLPQRTTREFAGNMKMPTKGFDFEPPSFALGLDRHENRP